ncbi:hypothetical protein ABW20_dc0108482 [Dactylellina cionopaga]|nr:hypothetical protein ABW20_dc0108482 [Dactylellina cionopaga]
MSSRSPNTPTTMSRISDINVKLTPGVPYVLQDPFIGWGKEDYLIFKLGTVDLDYVSNPDNIEIQLIIKSNLAGLRVNISRRNGSLVLYHQDSDGSWNTERAKSNNYNIRDLFHAGQVNDIKVWSRKNQDGHYYYVFKTPKLEREIETSVQCHARVLKVFYDVKEQVTIQREHVITLAHNVEAERKKTD